VSPVGSDSYTRWESLNVNWPRRADCALIHTGTWSASRSRCSSAVPARAAPISLLSCLAQSRGVDCQGRFLCRAATRYLDRLKALRGPGESYSDVIMRLANETA
jgi:hypothetical protein